MKYFKWKYDKIPIELGKVGIQRSLERRVQNLSQQRREEVVEEMERLVREIFRSLDNENFN